MMISLRLFLLILFSLSINASASELGSVTGVIPLPEKKIGTVALSKYRGKISGKVADAPAVIAGVWLESDKLSAPKKNAPVSMAQENYQFSNHLMIIPKGTTVLFPNKDSDYHNIYSLSKTKRFDIGRYKSNTNPVPSVTFDKAGYVNLRCEIHDHMNANIVVVDSPYFVTTDANGKFTLKNIPAGNYILHAQVDKKLKWQTPVKVVADKAVSIEL